MGGGRAAAEWAVEEFPNSGDIWLADSGQVEQADLHTGTKPTCKTDRPTALHCAHRHSGMLPTVLPAAVFVRPTCLFTGLSVHLPTCLSSLLVSLSIYLPVSVEFTCLSSLLVSLSIYLPVSVEFTCLVYLSLCPSIYLRLSSLPVSLSSLFVSLSIYLPVCV